MNLEDYLSMLHKLAERERGRPAKYLKNSPPPSDQEDGRGKDPNSTTFS